MAKIYIELDTSIKDKKAEKLAKALTDLMADALDISKKKISLELVAPAETPKEPKEKKKEKTKKEKPSIKKEKKKETPKKEKPKKDKTKKKKTKKAKTTQPLIAFEHEASSQASAEVLQ